MNSERFSISERWTDLIGTSPWTPIPHVFLQHYSELGISHSEAMLIIHLMQFKWEVKAPFPRMATLAKRMGISPTAVRAHARKLEQKGFVERKKRPGKSNYYLFGGLFDALEAKMRDDDSVGRGGVQEDSSPRLS